MNPTNEAKDANHSQLVSVGIIYQWNGEKAILRLSVLIVHPRGSGSVINKASKGKFIGRTLNVRKVFGRRYFSRALACVNLPMRFVGDRVTRLRSGSLGLNDNSRLDQSTVETARERREPGGDERAALRPGSSRETVACTLALWVQQLNLNMIYRRYVASRTEDSRRNLEDRVRTRARMFAEARDARSQ